MLRERAAPQKAKRAAGMKFDVAHAVREALNRYIVNRYSSRDSRFTNLKLRFPSVINSVDLPAVRIFMATDDGAVVQLQIPFTPRPNLFVPPISGNQIRTALLDDVSPNVCAANMRRPVFIQEDRYGHCRTKSAHCCSVRCPQRMGRFSAGDSGLYSPREGLQTKCIRPVCFIQNRRANAIDAEQCGQARECF